MQEARATLDSLNLREAPDLTLEQHILLIRNMPDQLIEYKYGIIVDSSWLEDDLEIIKAARKEYIAKARWLDYYLLNDMEALYECENTDKAAYKPLAEIDLAWYRLAQEVFAWQERNPTIFLFSPKQMRSPACWMTLCEIQFCSSRLQNSLSGVLKGIRYGKVSDHEKAIKHKAILSNTAKLQFAEGLAYAPCIQALEQIAARITKHDGKFRNAGYCSQYGRVVARCFREIRYNKALRSVLINSEGTLQLLEKGKSTKGFCKSS